MMRLRLGSTLWLDRYSGRVPEFPTLTGSHETDVAIVGGGVTGCACAYLLARAGISSVVVEARRIGRGSTAASTALLMQEPDADFSGLADRYGIQTARRIWMLSRQSVSSLVHTVRYLKTEADVRNLPSIYFARDADAARQLRAEFRLRRRARIAAEWLSLDRLKSIAGLDGEGAILTTGNAQVDPYAACLSLARAARKAGASFFERSRVRRIRRSPDGVRLELSRGSISAAQVIIATGYATAEFKPLAGRFRMMNTYVVATPRLDAAMRRGVGLGRAMLWDTERPYHYGRWTPDQRLVFGGEDRPHRPGKTRVAAIRSKADALMDDLVTLYPALQGVGPEYVWEGLFAVTPDGLPYIGAHRRYPRHLFALGYGGNGMTFGFLAAGILQRALRGQVSPGDELFAFNRHAE